ncbi:hypothetical protein [Rhodococcus jostii]|uniref:hypothetical protein n=1 Tax=Rhodococcus jostii TaxID=132919 RepID=UPI001ED952E2|nr:hypothetical protein [Rhodococcus jostii]
MSSWDDKIASQAQAIEPMDDFEAIPLEGPGRWAHPYEGVTLYTNDDNILFPESDGTPAANGARSLLLQALDKAFQAGESATSAFDRLRNGAPVTTGDLSELA